MTKGQKLGLPITIPQLPNNIANVQDNLEIPVNYDVYTVIIDKAVTTKALIENELTNILNEKVLVLRPDAIFAGWFYTSIL